MKRKLFISILLGLCACLMSVALFACGGKNDDGNSSQLENSEDSQASEELGEGLSFKTLTVDGKNVYGVVSNATKTFSFADEVTAHGKTKVDVSLDIYGTQTALTKTIPLKEGDNVVYVMEILDDKVMDTYTVTIRRRPMYTVTFNTAGGTAIESQRIEETYFATEPESAERAGYAFMGWDYDFALPIIENTTITANWEANKNTKYTVNYYLQNLDDNNYTLHETVELTGMTDTKATAEIKEYEHFTFNQGHYNNKLSGNINGNGSCVLSIYYTRNIYTLSVDNKSYGNITNWGNYKYGKEITSTATPYLGYEFIGWYSSEELLSTDFTYTFTVDKNVAAKFAEKAEMSNFNFTSTATTCTITGIKDKTVTEIIVPDSVTSIGEDAFSGCSSLTSVYITDLTAWCNISFDGYYANPLCEAKNLYLNNELVTELEIPNAITEIKPYAFYSCDSLTSVEIPDSVTSIGSSAFYSCDSLTSVEIPDSVTSIGFFAFAWCDSLTSVEIGDSVTIIGFYAFYSDSLTSVYYKGTASDWSKISISSSNNKLNDATRYYYSETEPTTSGKYWHYDENGEIVIWGYTGKE